MLISSTCLRLKGVCRVKSTIWESKHAKNNPTPQQCFGPASTCQAAWVDLHFGNRDTFSQMRCSTADACELSDCQCYSLPHILDLYLLKKRGLVTNALLSLMYCMPFFKLKHLGNQMFACFVKKWLWLRKLSTLQVKKTPANRWNTGKLSKPNQFESICPVNTHNTNRQTKRATLCM